MAVFYHWIVTGYKQLWPFSRYFILFSLTATLIQNGSSVGGEKGDLISLAKESGQ